MSPKSCLQSRGAASGCPGNHGSGRSRAPRVESIQRLVAHAAINDGRRVARPDRRVCPEEQAACDSSTVARSLDGFFAQYLLASVIRNGDAHLKNFGSLYGPTRAATLSPVYDMLSMAVYAPKRNDGDADDGMALTLNGSRRWPAPAMLSGLARRCRVSHGREAFWVDRLVTALVDAARETTKDGSLADVDATTRAAIARMLELWSIGLRPYNSVAAEFVRQLSRGGSGPLAL